MNKVKIFKALANETRLQILEWLRKPEVSFASFLDKKSPNPREIGICVGFIQQKSMLSQSTISEYLALLQDAGLIKSTRIGQWTYYKRNEKAIAEVSNFLK